MMMIVIVFMIIVMVIMNIIISIIVITITIVTITIVIIVIVIVCIVIVVTMILHSYMLMLNRFYYPLRNVMHWYYFCLIYVHFLSYNRVYGYNSHEYMWWWIYAMEAAISQWQYVIAHISTYGTVIGLPISQMQQNVMCMERKAQGNPITSMVYNLVMALRRPPANHWEVFSQIATVNRGLYVCYFNHKLLLTITRNCKSCDLFIIKYLLFFCLRFEYMGAWDN